MTIKAKLIANVLFTAAIIVTISLASFFSMRFIQKKLTDLTENSTPFQIRSIELQRELNGAITTLVKVNAARSMTEYTALQTEAEKSLIAVANVQKNLKDMSETAPDVSTDLDLIALELLGAVKERIKSNDAAIAANAKILQHMKVSSSRLDDLDSYVSNLQGGYTKAYVTALEQTDKFSDKLKNIEELRNLIRELQLVAVNVQNIHNGTTVLIAKGKIKALAGRITKNEYFKTNKTIAAIVTGFIDLLGEYVRLKSVALTLNDAGSQNRAVASGKDIPDRLGVLFQTLDQESMLVRDELMLASRKQGDLFSQSTIANDILVANSQLVTLGLQVTELTNRLFTTDSIVELQKLDEDIKALFSRIQRQVGMMNTNLTKLNNLEELKILDAAVVSLNTIRSEIHSPQGILATLKLKLSAIKQANSSADKLHDVVSRQISMGKVSVLVAQGEQKKSIATANSTIRQSLSQILGVGGVAIVIGFLFGFWIYRSVLQPLRVVLKAVRCQQKLGKEKADLATAVAEGELGREVTISEPLVLDSSQIQKDEMGMVLKAVVEMSEAQVILDQALAGMTFALRSSRAEEERRDRMKSGLNELNNIVRGEHKNDELVEYSLAFIAAFLDSGVGAMYLYDEQEDLLQCIATYAISKSGRLATGFKLGEGLVGQVAQSRKMICLKAVPSDYLPITSALGAADPLNIVILPMMHNNNLVGVVELGSFRLFDGDDFDFLGHALEGVAIAVSVSRSHQQLSNLLEKTQAQAEELHVQQEELQQTNEELAERALVLAEQRGHGAVVS